MISTPHWLVAVGVLQDRAGSVLITQRDIKRHQGGYWEFPGGKLEPGESVLDGLARELDEELGITLTEARPLIRIPFEYPDCQVTLAVFRVLKWQGQPHGRENQPMRWCPLSALDVKAFPAANAPIINALKLPPVYAITPDCGPREQWSAWLEQLESILKNGAQLVQLRVSLPPSEQAELAKLALEYCQWANAKLLINRNIELAAKIGADGVHLSAAQLKTLSQRPLSEAAWVAASCHSSAQLAAAVKIGADFGVLSPVRPTRSHLDARPIGWAGFGRLAAKAPFPLYALGGMHPEDTERARQLGGQGVAGISGFL